MILKLIFVYFNQHVFINNHLDYIGIKRDDIELVPASFYRVIRVKYRFTLIVIQGVASPRLKIDII